MRALPLTRLVREYFQLGGGPLALEAMRRAPGCLNAPLVSVRALHFRPLKMEFIVNGSQPGTC